MACSAWFCAWSCTTCGMVQWPAAEEALNQATEPKKQKCHSTVPERILTRLPEQLGEGLMR